MKTKLKLIAILALLSTLNHSLSTALAQTTAFTYQGRLNDGVNPANGKYDFQFQVFDQPGVGTGSSYGSPNPNTFSAVAVSNGLFTVVLDFGTGVFTGPDRWLQISARTNGNGSYGTLSPRQKLTATPYAIYSPNAGAATTATTAINLSGSLAGDVTGAQSSTVVSSVGGQSAGSVSTGVMAANLATNIAAPGRIVKRDSFGGFSAGFITASAFNGPGAGLTGLNASQLTSGTVADARLSGNVALLNTSQTFSGANNFLGNVGIGTTNPQSALHVVGKVTATAFSGVGNQPLEFFLNGARALRLEYNYNVYAPQGDSPSLTAGSVANYVSASAVGATIGGGGSTNTGNNNSLMTAKYPGGGLAFLLFSGGFSNSIGAEADYATIAGGRANSIGPNSINSVIGGGAGNLAGEFASSSVIAGGAGNVIRTLANFSTISGGYGNSIGTNSEASTIAGGESNIIGTNSYMSTIGGGYNNTIGSNSLYATVPGGRENTAGGRYSFAAGYRAKATNDGTFVWADTPSSLGADFASTSSNQFLIRASGGVGIGTNNPQSALHVVGTVTASAFMGNGAGLSNVNAAMLGGLAAPNFWQGEFNTISSLAADAVIGGGQNNSIQFFSTSSVIGGGGNNTIEYQSQRSVIGGGSFNAIRYDSYGSTIAGGFVNSVSNGTLYATIGGGSYNTIETNAASSTIGGGYLNVIRRNAQCATIPGGSNNVVAGNFGFAAGRRAQANHVGSFVWADSQDADFVTTAGNQFLIRASGGVGIGTTNPLAMLNVNGNARIEAASAGYSEGLTLNLPTDMPGGGYGGVHFHNAPRGGNYDSGTIKWGMYYNYTPEGNIGGGGLAFAQGNVNTRLYLASNGNVGIGTSNPQQALHVVGNILATGTVNGSSDRNVKENFAAVSPRAVLDKVAALPITRWNYKADAGVTHVGPMAQDFYAAFDVGMDDQHISMVDADGVALAAIQGLNQKLDVGSQKSDDRIKKLEAENAELKQRLAALEKIVRSQKPN